MLVFATPKFCTSAQCGPTLDKIKPFAAQYPGVTFINVEPYKLKLVDGVLHQGAKMVLGGPSKARKSWSLIDLMLSRDAGPYDRAIDVQISRLRKMIEPDPTQPRYIQTVWGVGYVFVPDGNA